MSNPAYETTLVYPGTAFKDLKALYNGVTSRYRDTIAKPRIGVNTSSMIAEPTVIDFSMQEIFNSVESKLTAAGYLPSIMEPSASDEDQRYSMTWYDFDGALCGLIFYGADQEGRYSKHLKGKTIFKTTFSNKSEFLNVVNTFI